MTREQILKLLPNASASTLARNLGDQWTGPHPSDKKLHVCHREKGKPRVEKAVRSEFHLAVAFRMSDGRLRDLDAGLSTIQDCIITARRQLEDNLRDQLDRHPNNGG